ncbi:MAG: 2-dehydropantoate 2-reductase, partial [Microbacterium sp.]
MTAQPYVIVGAGAIGGTIAHALIRAGHHVTLVDTDAAHVAALRADGLTILRDDGPTPVEDTVAVPAAHTPDEAPRDEAFSAAIVAVKSQHTADAAAWLADGRLAADGYAVSLQNGANEPVLASALGEARVIGAFVDIFADWERPGVIRYGGPGALAVGIPGTGVPDARVLRTA